MADIINDWIDTTITLSGGTETHVPSINFITLSGLATLSADWEFVRDPAGGAYDDFDTAMYQVFYNAAITLNGKTMDIFGISINAGDALSGKFLITAFYDKTNDSIIAYKTDVTLT